MICKFFKTQTGGGVSAINYLLDKRVNQGTARILKGDEFLTRELIKSMTQKHKTCVGVLSFEEKNIDENTKKEIMESFENTLLTPAMQGRYNILWVEHSDKGRLELNFVIPKIDLESKKAFNPYFHIADSKRIDFWRDFVNLCYGFTNPKDPAKEQTLQGSKKEKELFKDYEALDKILHKQVANEIINSRDELIYFLKQNNIEVTRKGKDYLSIKLPESKKAKRFKGSIYNEQFTGFTELREIRREKESRAREYQQRDIKQELERLKRELENFIQSKDEYYRETFRKINERLQREARKFDRKNGETQLQNTTNEIQAIEPSNELSSGNAYDDDFTRDCVVSVDKALSDQQRINDKGQRRGDISLDTKTENGGAREPLLPTNELKRNEIDNARSRINSRNREITRQDNRISTSRDEITRDNKDRTNSIRERFGSYEKQIQQLNTEFQGLERANARNREAKRTRIEAIRDFIQAKYTEFRERIRNSFKKPIKKTMRIIQPKRQATKKRDFGMER
ncbi:mobilization protein [Campylobacter coli]|uniref:relaxase/mobilization nuclease domain-containing protein n=2 Tax=Campylobacter TaxID=194 RepID=UPI000931B0AD|nr:relaxase/mobilization nuclease domain-containing protein [Campylobacter coli]OOX97225.1 mobilization protein [Campylobacter coli]OOX97228.1 mobilization protein [Campylobacter coli]